MRCTNGAACTGRVGVVWALVPKPPRIDRNHGSARFIGPNQPARAKPPDLKEPALISRRLALPRNALHTREVAGSKPAAPMVGRPARAVSEGRGASAREETRRAP